MGPLKIVVRYLDGTVRKGHTRNFNPQARRFALMPLEAEPGTQPEMIEMCDLKAVFFVRDFAGNPGREDRQQFLQRQTYQGHKVEVTFKDGEVMTGSTANYDPEKHGFFVFPADEDSNTLKAFVVARNTKKVRLL